MAGTLARTFIADRTITHAQLLTLRATPIEVIPAPGVDKQIILESVFIVADTRTAAYSNASGGDISLRWKTVNPGGANISFNIVDKFTASGLGQLFNAPFTEPTTLEQSGNNMAMEIFKAGAGELTAGSPNNSFSIRLYYRITPAIPFTPGLPVQD